METAHIHIIAGRVGGAICMAAFFPYIVSILRGKTKPNRASWWIWVVVGIILAKAYYEAGGRNNLPGTVAGVIGPIITALLSIKYGEGGFSKFDRRCIVAAIVSVILWKGFDSPILGLAGGLFTDLIGTFPTWKELYKDSTKEEATAWVMFSIGNVVSMFAIEHLTLKDALYPTYFLCATGVTTTLVLRGRSKAVAPTTTKET